VWLFNFVGASRGHHCDSTAFLLSYLPLADEMKMFINIPHITGDRWLSAYFTQSTAVLVFSLLVGGWLGV